MPQAPRRDLWVMLLANTFRAFRQRDYFLYWIGLLRGHTGTLIQTTAQNWLIF